MSNWPEWVAQYGQLGAMIWMAFEIRDIRRRLHLHEVIHHPRLAKALENGEN